MKKAAIICIGKIKQGIWLTAALHYQELLRHWRHIQYMELKDGANEPLKRKKTEGARILSSLSPTDYPIALHESGKEFTSTQFAELLLDCDERLCKRPAFIIGGPYGLDESVLQASRLKLSLSRMTWTHELARVLLLEQLYRAESILHNTPYHH